MHDGYRLTTRTGFWVIVLVWNVPFGEEHECVLWATAIPGPTTHLARPKEQSAKLAARPEQQASTYG